MQKHKSKESGFSLVETIISMGVLTVGAIGMAAVFAQGLQSTATSPNELLATQKAAEAIESVFSARDARTLTWAQVRNIANGGIFLNGATNMNLAGADGILNTAIRARHSSPTTSNDSRGRSGSRISRTTCGPSRSRFGTRLARRTGRIS